LGVLLGLLTARPPDRLTAQSVAPTIDTIIVVNRNVFDLQEGDAPSFVARLANRLHARTRARVILGTLLVNRGDRYDSARVAESERALRNLNVFRQVRIDTTRLEGHRLALRVATADGWSTKPQLGYSSAGGDVSWLVGLVEDNLLGTATSLAAVYNRSGVRL
jgi:outer membrane protein assembly factor BamA